MPKKRKLSAARRTPRSSARTERGLRPHAALLGRMAEGLGIGMALADSSRRLRYANRAFRDLFGPAFSLQKSLAQLAAPRSRAEIARAFLEAESGHVLGVFTIQTETGKFRTMRFCLGSLDDGGEPLFWIIAKDITELQDMDEVIRTREASIQSLSGRILRIQDEERRRVARELHDTTGQELAVMVMWLNAATKELRNQGAETRKPLEGIAEMARKVQSEIRTLSYLLHPPMLDEYGLASAFRWYAEGFQKRSHIPLELHLPTELPRLSPDRELALFRVFQESLTNVVRHAPHSEVSVRLERDAGRLLLLVENSTKKANGTAPRAVEFRRALKLEPIKFGVGILGMKERLQQVAGRLEIRRTATGMIVGASVPAADGLAGDSQSAAASAAAPSREPAPLFSATGAGAPGETDSSAPGSPAPAAPGADSAPARTRVLIVDDHELMRRGVRTLLEAEGGFEVCGEAADGIAAIAQADSLRPDLIILDLTMPGMGGFQAASQIKKLLPAIRILVFTNHYLAHIAPMLRQIQCEGYVTKTRAGSDLIRGIRAVLAGERFFPSVPDSAASIFTAD